MSRHSRATSVVSQPPSLWTSLVSVRLRLIGQARALSQHAGLGAPSQGPSGVLLGHDRPGTAGTLATQAGS
jgi:hypothetical protein